MRPRILIALLALGLSVCSKNEVRTCNPKTLLVKFSCDQDLAEADGLALEITRNDGGNATLATPVKCPGTHSYEIKISNYDESRSFSIIATATRQTTSVSEPNTLTNIGLQPGCTVIDFALRKNVNGGNDASVDAEPVPPACPNGSLACPCNNGTCADGLVCMDSICSSPSCGNGTVEKGEDCDDKNPADDDACSNACVSCAKRAGHVLCGNTCLVGTCCPGSVCRPESCNGTMTTAASTCSGDGQCPVAAPAACPGNLTCDVGSCRSTCTLDAHCAAGTICESSKCVPKRALGTACLSQTQCDSGNCVDGVCCSASTCPACQKCNVKGDGTCGAVAAGQPDTKAMCTDQGAASCGQNGLCDGNSGCQTYACTCDGFVMPNSASSGLPNTASYDITMAGVVTDRTTKLVWEQPTDSTTRTQAEAAANCAAKGGGWRLPTVLELFSIVDPSRKNPALDGVVFSSIVGFTFWSSTPVAGNASKAWQVGFDIGIPKQGDLTDKRFSRCVRSVAGGPLCYPPTRFITTTAEAYDAKTKLTWQRMPAPTTKTAAEAAAYCGGLGNSYRVPSVKELLTLVEYSQVSPSINTDVFLGPSGTGYWTSSVVVGSAGAVWQINFYDGAVYDFAPGNLQVRCVR